MQSINLGKIRFNWKGDYNATTTYAQNDCVHFGGHALVCTADNTTGVTPVSGVTANTPWQFMAKGVDVLTSKGDIVTFDGTNLARLGIGAKGQVLTVDENNMPSWQAQQSRPATTVWLGSGLDKSGAGQSGLCQHHGGAYQSAAAGSFNMSFIMSDQRRIKTVGRQFFGSGAQFRGDDVVIDFPQDAQIGDPLLAGEYFIGHSKSVWNTVAWTNLGNAYVYGSNSIGQLGVGDTVNRLRLTRIPYFTTNNIKIAKAISTGVDQWNQYSTFFLTTDGRVFGSGFNGNGQLGNGTTTNQVTPVQCGSITGITDIFVSTGATVSIYAINSSGQLWVWGYNIFGQLGLGDTTDRSTPVLSSLTNVKYVRPVASNSYNGTDWQSTAFRAFVLKTDGTVWACGQNGGSQLGLGDTTQRNAWTQVTGIPIAVRDLYVANAVNSVTFAIGTNGLTYVWGTTNSCGTLWQTDANVRSTPVLFGMNNTNAAGWDQFWLLGYQRQNAAIGKRIDQVTGKATYWQIGNTSGWSLGAEGVNNSFPVQVPIPENVSVVDITLFSVGSSESFNAVAFYLLSTGEVLHAGGCPYSICGNKSSAYAGSGALSAVKF